MTIFIDRHTEVLTFSLRLTGNARWQVHLDPFHVHLAQAHHHEAGEQKEHDVDQRDDLDPRFLVRNWRAYVHWIPLHWIPLDGRAFPRSLVCPSDLHLARRALCS